LNIHIFPPVVIKTTGLWSQQATGKHVCAITKGSRETTFLLQTLSMAQQWANAVSFSELSRKESVITLVHTLLVSNLYSLY